MPYIGNIVQDFSVNNAMLNSDSVTSIKIVDGTIEGADIAANLDLSDSQKIRFGAGNDLQIYHDGTESVIHDAGTGLLRLRTDSFRLRNAANTEHIIKAVEDGAVELYFNTVKKFETTSGGAAVTGELDVSDTIDMNTDTGRLKIGAGDDLQIYHDGSHSYIDNNTGSLRFRDAGGAEKFRISGSGTQFNDDITLSNDNDKINIGASADLKIYHDSNNSLINADGTGNLIIQGANDIILRPADGEVGIDINANGAVELYHDNSKKFETKSTGVIVSNQGNNRILDVHHTNGDRAYIAFLDQNTTDNSYVRIGALADEMVIFSGGSEVLRLTSNGKVGIGTTSPSGKLDVTDGTTSISFNKTNNTPRIDFKGNNVSELCQIKAAESSGGGVLQLFTKTTGGTATERMRLDVNGHVLFTSGSSQRVAFGATDNTKYAGFGRHDGAAQDVGLNFFTTTNAGTTFVNHFRIDHNGDLLGTDTNGVSSISDSRVKTDITDYTYDLAKFKQFAPKQFNWKNPEYHGEKTNVKGFLAQDLEAIDTQWVGSSFIEKDHPDYDLVDKSKNSQDEDVGVAKTSKFGGKDAMYISVINQLIARVEALEAG